jgi:cysteine desulfurase family protein
MRFLPGDCTLNISELDDMIYLDNAATSWPKPEIVYRTMDKFLREKGGNPGHGSHSLAMAAKQEIEETRVLVARFLHAPETERVIFTLNCTDSINVALKGLLKPGDQVIVSSLEHNAVIRPLSKLSECGIDVIRIPLSPETGVTSAQDIEKAISPRTRLIEMIHASNVNGVIQPIEEYGEIARRHNLIFMVDGAQTAGHYPLDVVAANIDLLAFSGHKGTLGSTGVGVLYIGPRVNPETLREGGTGSVSESALQPETLPDKFESGTLNSVGISGLGAGIKFILEQGQDKILHHENKLMESLIQGLSRISGVKIYKAVEGSDQAPVISINIDGYEPGEAGVILDQAFDIKVRTGLHCSPEAHKSMGTFPKGTIRLSPGYFNTLQDIEFTLQAIRKLATSFQS